MENQAKKDRLRPRKIYVQVPRDHKVFQISQVPGKYLCDSIRSQHEPIQEDQVPGVPCAKPIEFLRYEPGEHQLNQMYRPYGYTGNQEIQSVLQLPLETHFKVFSNQSHFIPPVHSAS